MPLHYSVSVPEARSSLATGLGRVLVIVYAILALAAAGRSVSQIITRFDEAPIAFTLSALAAAVYIVATIALVAKGPVWNRVAWIAIGFELAGVIVIGAISLLAPQLLGLPDTNPFGRYSTVWSDFGAGYLCIPLVLPVLGLLWLRSRRAAGRDGAATSSSEVNA
nr:hypothetical protein [Schumannella luteola]